MSTEIQHVYYQSGEELPEVEGPHQLESGTYVLEGGKYFPAVQHCASCIKAIPEGGLYVPKLSVTYPKSSFKSSNLDGYGHHVVKVTENQISVSHAELVTDQARYVAILGGAPLKMQATAEEKETLQPALPV